jgi:hypothetical protein
MTDRGYIVWGGRVGGQVLQTPDAEITYQVKVDELAVGPITNEGVLTIKDGRSYSLKATTKLPWVTVGLTGPAVVGNRAPIRYQITVTNESGATLQNVNVEATWMGGAYPVWPDPTSWVIPALGPGATWTKNFTLWTFSLATGQVVTTITVTHPWIETTTASATTTIVH